MTSNRNAKVMGRLWPLRLLVANPCRRCEQLPLGLPRMSQEPIAHHK